MKGPLRREPRSGQPDAALARQHAQPAPALPAQLGLSLQELDQVLDLADERGVVHSARLQHEAGRPELRVVTADEAPPRVGQLGPAATAASWSPHPHLTVNARPP